jgi:hypothetical protein
MLFSHALRLLNCLLVYERLTAVLVWKRWQSISRHANMPPSKREILIGRWYVPTKRAVWPDGREVDRKPRWVLGLYVHQHDGRERVLYSTGGDGDHMVCLRSSFSKWVRYARAYPATGDEVRTLEVA